MVKRTPFGKLGILQKASGLFTKTAHVLCMVCHRRRPVW